MFSKIVTERFKMFLAVKRVNMQDMFSCRVATFDWCIPVNMNLNDIEVCGDISVGQ